MSYREKKEAEREGRVIVCLAAPKDAMNWKGQTTFPTEKHDGGEFQKR